MITVEGKPKLVEAENLISERKLWLMPNLDCNRLNHPCDICFASTLMRDAKQKGYQHASLDFLEKIRTLSRLPWEEVVITGGEPTKDSALLDATLSSIDPSRKIRIITNADWTLDDRERKDLISRILSSGRQVQVDISAHEPYSRPFMKKVWALIDSGIATGVQLRVGESKTESGPHDHYYKYQFALGTGLSIEEHHVLRMGEGVKLGERNGVECLSLEQLITYSSRENNKGIYLVPGSEGTRVIANHETAYLTSLTPADLAKPEGSAEVVLGKVLAFYTDSSLDLTSDRISYAAACFKDGVPLSLGLVYTDHKLDLFEQAKIKERNMQFLEELMESYYQTIGELSGISVDELKMSLTKELAKKVLKGIYSRERVEFSSHLDQNPMPYSIAYDVPRDPKAFMDLILDEILVVSAGRNRQYRNERERWADETNSPSAKLMRIVSGHHSYDFHYQLALARISQETLLKCIARTYRKNQVFYDTLAL